MHIFLHEVIMKLNVGLYMWLVSFNITHKFIFILLGYSYTSLERFKILNIKTSRFTGQDILLTAPSRLHI